MLSPIPTDLKSAEFDHKALGSDGQLDFRLIYIWLSFSL